MSTPARKLWRGCSRDWDRKKESIRAKLMGITGRLVRLVRVVSCGVVQRHLRPRCRATCALIGRIRDR